MKKIIILFMILLSASIAKADGLNSNASYIKDKYSDDYSTTLRKHALDKWNDDYEMVVYMINEQADALVELINEFKSDNTSIVYKAIQKWSYDGYDSWNIQKFKEITTFNLESLIPLHCDWEMVKYEYDNQVKAKNSF